MTVSAAVDGWVSYIQPLKAKGFRLGAPAVSNSVQSGQGLQWLSSFLSACTSKNCTFDFIPIHWYGDAGDVSGFQNYVTQAYQMVTSAGNGKYGKLWITEFGVTSSTGADQTAAFLKSVMQWMDGSTGNAMVEKYAWFMDATGNLITSDGSALSSLGQLYNSG